MINLRHLLRLTIKPNLTHYSLPPPFLLQPHFSFAYMQLFERHKRPEELDPVFKRQTRLKGHLKSKALKFYSPKKNKKVKEQKQRLKNHKGLLKRVKIVGPRWNRQFKFESPGKRHLLRKKSSSNLLRKRRTRYVAKSDLYKVKKLIPYFKRRSLKQRY